MANLSIDVRGTLDNRAERSNSTATSMQSGDSFSLLHSPAPAQWSKTYGGTTEAAFSDLIQSGGGFALVGSTNSYGAGDWDLWLVKAYAWGDVQWNQTYGGTEGDYGSALLKTEDLGFALAGSTMSYGAGHMDSWLVKTDAFGNHQWNQTYGGTGYEDCSDMIQTTDGGFALVGMRSSGVGDYALWLVKTDASGNHQWNKTYGQTGLGAGYALIQTTDGGYALASYNGSGNGGAWLIKTDASGNTQWDKTYRGTGSDVFDDLIQTADGGYALAGWTKSWGAGEQDFWLVKTDASGNHQWNKTYGSIWTDKACDLIQTADGGYALTGFWPGDPDPYWALWLVKTDASGNYMWNQSFGGAGDDLGRALLQTADEGYVIAGLTNSYGAGSNDGWLIKTEPADWDGDGLLDKWETNGIDSNSDGSIDLILSGANPEYKDLYLEIDYMDSDGTHDHNPNTNAVSDVIQAFRNAPVGNPNGTTGVALHIDVDESITHQNVIDVWDDFDTIKNSRFGTATQRSDPNSVYILAAKRMAYRYCLFIHQYARNGATTTSSGVAELPGNDFIVSLGAFDNQRGTRDQQAGTLMHELGHTLNLRHGGGDNINGKPNYLSIMSYSRQFSVLVPNRPLDYSRTKCPSLNESSLTESLGVRGPTGYQTVYGLLDPNTDNSRVDLVDTNTAVDWNRDSDTTDTSVAQSVNYFWYKSGTEWYGYGDNTLDVLEGYDDWPNIQYNFRSTGEYSDGVHLNVADQEITWEILEMIRNITVNPTPDVAVVSVTPNPTSVAQGETITITVVVKNEANFSQGFIVTGYYDNTAISSQTVTILAPGGLRILNFHWNTAGVTLGTYAIKAVAGTVPDETDIADNTKIDGTITITDPPPGVGGVAIPVDKFGLLAPYIGVASAIVVATVASAIYVKRVKRRKEKQ